MEKFFSQNEQKNNDLEILKECADNGAHEAIIQIHTEYGDKEKGLDFLPFHNEEHTKGVIERSLSIVDAIRKSNPELVSDKDTTLVKIASAFHDIVQKWEESRSSSDVLEKITRKRFISENEKDSASAAEMFMQNENKKHEREIFSKDDIEKVKEAIMGTVPGFDVEKNTVVQPNINENSKIIARVLALSDIGTAGMEGSENFLKEGNDLFREDNLDIMEKIESGNISEDEKESIKKRIMGWTKFQELFAAGRKEKLKEEISVFSEDAQKALEELFNTFDDSIQGAKNLAEKRIKMTFEEIIKDIGY